MSRVRSAALLVARTALLGLALGAAWVLAARNASLREEARSAARRGAVLREIVALRERVPDVDAGLAEPPGGWSAALEAAVKRCGARLTASTAKDGRPVGSHVLQRRQLALEGSYEAIVKFFAWLESTPSRTRISEFTLAASAPDRVQANLTVLVPAAAKR